MDDITLPRKARSFAESLVDRQLGLESLPPFVELLPMAIYACDSQGRILWCNQKAIELWGRAPRLRDDGERFCGFFKGYAQGREITREHTRMAEVLRDGVAVEAFEGCIERPDGTRLWVTMHIDPVHDGDGNLIGAINCFHDTTVAHKGNETLRERQQDLEDFFENGAVALHLVGHDGTILRANQAELDLLGYSRDEYIGRNIRDFHVDAPVIGAILDRLCAGQKLDRYPARLRARDGSIRHVLITSNAQLRDGEFVNTRCFTIDVTDWKNVDRELSESAQRLAAIYEHANVGIVEVDADGRVLRANRTVCEITGRSRQQLLQRNIFDSTQSEMQDLDRGKFQDLIAGKIDRYMVEKHYIRGDGSKIWMEVISSAVRGADGSFLFGVRVSRDITKARLWAQALAENEQRLAATYEHAAIGISEVDADGRLVRVNEAVCSIIGYTAEELLKLTVFDVTHPEDRPNDRERFVRQASGGTGSYTVEKRLICKDGRIIWASVTSSSVYDAAGRFLYGIRVLQDITARKRTEEIVRESERHLRQVLEALPAAIYTTDASGLVNFYNQAAVALSGRQPRLGADKWCVSWRLYDPEGRPLPHDQCPMAIALKEDRPVHGRELIVERPDGARSSVHPYPTPLHDASGALVGAVNMLVDVTERKEAEARQKSLIDELNHRVKNTLATVQSLAAQTLRGTELAGYLREDFTARLFALSKTHDQLSMAGWETADFKSLVHGIVAPFQLQSGNQVRVVGPSVNLAPNAALLLAMVLHELATNAAKYGALSLPTGKLDLTWAVGDGDGGRRLTIEWRETEGPKVRKPERRGFGSRLAERAILHELQGKAQVRFDPAGVHCKFEIPLLSSKA